MLDFKRRKQNNLIINKFYKNSSMKYHKKGYLSQQEHYQQMQELIKRSYEGTSDIELYVQIDQITQWVHSQNEKPLLIISDQFGGKKTLICQFIKHFQRQRSNCFVISQFASVTSYYSEILYKITMQLRTLLGINQKVQLNQQKLRQYFRYWLEVADQKIQKDYLTYTKDQKMKVVIIIEGVDKVVDNKNQIVRPSFWLPDVNLKNLKIILTSQSGSTSIECLQPIVSQKIQFIISSVKVKTIKQKLIKLNDKLKYFSEQTHFGDLKIALKILNSHPQFQISQKNLTFEQFFFNFIHFVSKKIGNQEDVCRLLGCLIWSKKGLSQDTLRRSFKISPQQAQIFLSTFKDVIIKNQNETYFIMNRKMKQYINSIITAKLCHQQQVKKKIHACISKALKKQSNTVDTLQEMIHHLSSSGNFTQLKELLSRIQNFLVLYTPLTKHLLCMCWILLEIQFQYDPVFQYNKAIERFLNHYYPSPQDTFKIIFQLSLFFKQYSEFQNTKTPQFRHPPVRGEVQQLKQISIYQQLIQMNMYQKIKIRNRQSLNVDQNQHKEIQKEKERSKEKDKSIKEQTSQIQQFDIQRKQVEKLNVRIKFHQQKFKSLYLQEMQPYINQFYILKKKSLLNNNRLLDEDEEDSQTQLDESKIDLQKIRKGLLLKKYADYLQQQYHRCSLKRSFYYYKQWIWMQFPWICQSLNNNYSQLIDRCMKSPTQYMTIDLEQKLISDAVKIAKIAKQNKKQIYQNNQNDINLKLINKQVSAGILTNRKQKHKTTYLKNNYKFDLSRLDEELQKSKLTRKTYKPNKYSQNESITFVTDISGNNSYFEQKQNNQDQSQVKKLPYILKCSSLAASKAQKNIDITKMRQYGLLVTKFDQLKYQNQQLVSKIQIIELNRQTLKQNNRQTQKQVIKNKIQELQQRKIKLLKSYKTQEALKVKLQMIIKLCDINKSHGSQSAHLNSFLNSLKFMFKIQKENLQIINQNGKKILQDNRNEYKKIKQQKINLQAKLKKQRNKLQKSVIILSSKCVQKLNEKSKLQSKKRRTPGKDEVKKRNKLDKQMEIILNQLNQLKSGMGIQSSKTQKNNSILLQFQNKKEKLNQIEWKLNELIEQNQQKQKRISELQEKLNVNRGHREHQKQLNQRGIQNQLNDVIMKAQQRIKCLEQCFNLIQQNKTPLQTRRIS